MSQIHQTRIATWKAQTLGKALILAAAVGVLAAAIARASDASDAMVVVIGVCAAILGAGLLLWTSTAPLPEHNFEDLK